MAIDKEGSSSFVMLVESGPQLLCSSGPKTYFSSLGGRNLKACSGGL